MNLIRPERLKRGDTIGIISPSSPIAAFCPRRLQRGADELTRMGFNVVMGKHVSARTGQTASLRPLVDSTHTNFWTRLTSI